MPPKQDEPRRLALVMVGLPARGKTYTARKLARYLTWLGHRAHVFNVGNYRRERVGSQLPHEFFDPTNPEGTRARWQMATDAMTDLKAWLSDRRGGIAIYDATNSTGERRRWVLDECRPAGIQVVFIETICNDLGTIESNVRETKLRSPDYAGVAPEDAVRDFRARIGHYERAYETIDDPSSSWVKLVDVGRQVVVNNIQGYLLGRLVFYLMNLHITPRPIWLTRHGESLDNVAGRIGGDSPLSTRGAAYAERLARFMAARVAEGEVRVWTSTLRRTIQTGIAVGLPTTSWRSLDEIEAGVCDGMTYAEIEESMPEEYAARWSDKLRYRYPRGESYMDVVQRVEPVLIELERQRSPVLVIAHQAVLRTLYAYFMDRPPEEIPHLPIPLHTVIQLTPKAYGAEEERFEL